MTVLHLINRFLSTLPIYEIIQSKCIILYEKKRKFKIKKKISNYYVIDQVDVSTQVDLHENASLQRGATPLYSREDIKEQYCITNRQLDAVEKSGGGIFGCLTSRGPSPCSSAAKASILSACVRSAPSDENLCDAPYPIPYPSHTRGHSRQMPPLIMYQQPYSTYPRHMSARYPSVHPYPYPFDLQDDEDWHESSFNRRRPKSFYSGPDPKRYVIIHFVD